MRHIRGRSIRFTSFVTLVALTAVVLLAGCGATGTDSSLLAASVNGQGISLTTYEAVLRFYEASNALPTNPGTPPTSEDWRTPQGRANLTTSQQGALDFLINLQLMRQELKQRHLTVPPADIAHNRATLDNQIKSAIAQHNATLTPVINALTPGVRDLFAEQQADEQVLTAHISVPTVHLRAIIVNSLSAAQSYETQAKNGANFGQLAKLHSQDPTSATTGGEFGTVYMGQYGPQFDSVVFNSRAGKYAILPLGNQFALLELTQRVDKPLTTLNNATAEQTVFKAWLKSNVRSHASISRFVITN